MYTRMSNSFHPRDLGVIVRNTQPEDICKIVDLQKESYPYLAPYGNIWHPEELESHLRIFPQFHNPPYSYHSSSHFLFFVIKRVHYHLVLVYYYL